VRGLQIQNEKTHANTDGIDIDTCRFVSVSDCLIDTGDDAITVRASCSRLVSGKNICEHIAISNCVLSTSAVGVRIGVGTGVIRNVKISGLVIARAGIGVQFITSYKNRGGVSISDVIVENIVADQVSFPFRLIQGNGAYIRNIKIKTFRAKAMCSSSFVAEDFGLISDLLVQDLSVDVIEPIYALDERAPEEKGWYALWGNGAKNVELDHIHFQIPPSLQEQWQGLYHVENCENVSVFHSDFEA
jgi:polygalacturonase